MPKSGSNGVVLAQAFACRPLGFARGRGDLPPTRDWQMLTSLCTFTGNGNDAFGLPADWQRMLLSAQVWRSTNTNAPMSYISDPDDWLRRELQGKINGGGPALLLKTFNGDIVLHKKKR